MSRYILRMSKRRPAGAGKSISTPSAEARFPVHSGLHRDQQLQAIAPPVLEFWHSDQKLSMRDLISSEAIGRSPSQGSGPVKKAFHFPPFEPCLRTWHAI